jgi:hypothetical protein
VRELFVEFLKYSKGEKGSTSCEDYCKTCQANDNGSPVVVSGDIEEWSISTDVSESLMAAVGGEPIARLICVGRSLSPKARASSTFEVIPYASGHLVVVDEHYSGVRPWRR